MFKWTKKSLGEKEVKTKNVNYSFEQIDWEQERLEFRFKDNMRLRMLSLAWQQSVQLYRFKGLSI